jgi:hypothetical protein
MVFFVPCSELYTQANVVVPAPDATSSAAKFTGLTALRPCYVLYIRYLKHLLRIPGG